MVFASTPVSAPEIVWWALLPVIVLAVSALLLLTVSSLLKKAINWLASTVSLTAGVFVLVSTIPIWNKIQNDGAIAFLNDSIGILNQVERELRCDKNSLITSIINLKSDNSKIKKKNELLILNNQNNIINNLIQSAEEHNGVRIITEILKDELNPNIISDQFRAKIKNCGILLIAFVSNSKPVFICSLTDDMALKINAVDVVKFAAKFIDGGGGGKKYYAKAGGKNVKGIQNAVSKTKKEVLSKI